MRDGECSVAWSRVSGLNTATLGAHEKAIWESVFGSAFVAEMLRLEANHILGTYRGPAVRHAIQRADQAIIALRELEEG